MPHGFNNIAGARFTFRPHHSRAFVDAPQCLAQIAAATNEGHFELPFVDVVLFIGRCKHFALVDVIHSERLQNLRLDKMTDPGLCHDGDGYGVDDALDHIRIAHAGDTPLHADIRRHALQRHDRYRAGIFGDARLIRRDHIHDDATLQHLRQSALDLVGAGCAAVLLMSVASHFASPFL